MRWPFGEEPIVPVSQLLHRLTELSRTTLRPNKIVAFKCIGGLMAEKVFHDLSSSRLFLLNVTQAFQYRGKPPAQSMEPEVPDLCRVGHS